MKWGQGRRFDSGKLTIPNAAVADKLKANAHILHGNRFPYPAPVPNDLSAHVTAVEFETLRCELLATRLKANAAAGEGDIGDATAAAIFSIHANLVRARLGYQLNVLRARGLSDLVMDACDDRTLLDLADVNSDVADLTIKVGRVDKVSKGK